LFWHVHCWRRVMRRIKYRLLFIIKNKICSYLPKLHDRNIKHNKIKFLGWTVSFEGFLGDFSLWNLMDRLVLLQDRESFFRLNFLGLFEVFSIGPIHGGIWMSVVLTWSIFWACLKYSLFNIFLGLIINKFRCSKKDKQNIQNYNNVILKSDDKSSSVIFSRFFI